MWEKYEKFHSQYAKSATQCLGLWLHAQQEVSVLQWLSLKIACQSHSLHVWKSLDWDILPIIYFVMGWTVHFTFTWLFFAQKKLYRKWKEQGNIETRRFNLNTWQDSGVGHKSVAEQMHKVLGPVHGMSSFKTFHMTVSGKALHLRLWRCWGSGGGLYLYVTLPPRSTAQLIWYLIPPFLSQQPCGPNLRTNSGPKSPRQLYECQRFIR